MLSIARSLQLECDDACGTGLQADAEAVVAIDRKQIISKHTAKLEELEMYILHSAVKLRPGKQEQFTERLRDRMVPLLANHGRKLLGSYVSVIGRRDFVVDLWEMHDANDVYRSLMSSDFHKHQGEKSDLIEDEIVTLMRPLPVLPESTK